MRARKRSLSNEEKQIKEAENPVKKQPMPYEYESKSTDCFDKKEYVDKAESFMDKQFATCKTGDTSTAKLLNLFSGKNNMRPDANQKKKLVNSTMKEILAEVYSSDPELDEEVKRITHTLLRISL